MSTSIKILLPMLVFLLPFQSLADQSLDDLKKNERIYAEFIEVLEKRVGDLKQRIKYWEYQLTGPRQWAYPRTLGLRGIVEGWIQKDKEDQKRAEQDLEIIKKKQKKMLDEIVAIETGDPIKRLQGSWEFGRKTGPKDKGLDKPQVIGTVTLTLQKGDHGYIIGGPYRHPNESFWEFEGNTLSFKHKEGAVTTSFSPTGTDWKNWEGDYKPVREPKVKGVVHYLKRK